MKGSFPRYFKNMKISFVPTKTCEKFKQFQAGRFFLIFAVSILINNLKIYSKLCQCVKCFTVVPRSYTSKITGVSIELAFCLEIRILRKRS